MNARWDLPAVCIGIAAWSRFRRPGRIETMTCQSELAWIAISKKLIPLLLIVGCSTTPITMEEREYKHVEMYQAWQLCKKVYLRSNASFVSQFTSTVAIQRGLKMPHADDMRRDMIANRCHLILRKYGHLGI